MGHRDMELTPSSTEDFVVFFLLEVRSSRPARSVGFDCFECRFPREPRRKVRVENRRVKYRILGFPSRQTERHHPS
jgi:hypothetical protein